MNITNMNKYVFLFKDLILITFIFLFLYLSFEAGYHLCENTGVISTHLDDYPISSVVILVVSLLSHSIIKTTKDKFFPRFKNKETEDIYKRIEELSDVLNKKDQEVIEGEKKYRNLFENASDLILILDDNGCIVDCNNKTLQTLGLSDEPEYRVTPVINFIENRKSKITQFNIMFSNVLNGNPVYFEFDSYNIKTKTETVFDASFNPVVIGSKLFVQGILRDVTIKKKLEKELQDSNDRYQSLYMLLRSISDNIPDMMWAKNKVKKYLFANKAICKNLLGCDDPEQVIGKTDLEFALINRSKYKHDFGEMCMDSDDIVMRDLKPSTFHEYGYALGSWIDLEVNKAPFFDKENNLIGTVGIGRDITSRLKLLNDMSEKEERFKKLFDSANDAIVVSKNGVIVDINKKALELFGYSREEFLRLTLLDISSPIQSNNKIVRQIEECYDGCKLTDETDEIILWNHRQKEGTIFSAEITCNTVTINHETYIQSIIRDVSDRRELERKLLKSEKTYKETVDAIPYVLHVVDKNHNLLLWNNKFINLLNRYGIDTTNVCGKNVCDILSSTNTDIKTLKTQLDYVLNTGQSTEEFKYNAVRVPVRNGHVSGVLSIVEDKVERQNNDIFISLSDFNNIIEIIQDGAILFNTQTGLISNANNLFLDITEYSREDLIDKHISDLNIWKTFDVYGKYKEYSDVFITKSKQEKFGQLYLEHITINHKKFTVLMIRDITFDKDIIESFKNKASEYNTIIDNIPIPFYCKTIDGKYSICNIEFQKFVGKPKTEILGATIFDVFENDDANLYYSNEEAVDSKLKCFEHKLKNDEIHSICQKYVSSPVFDGFIGTIYNVTGYKIKEYRLHRYKDLLYFIINHSKIPIFVKDLYGNYLIINQLFLDEFKINRDEFYIKINEQYLFDQDTINKIREIDKLTITANFYSENNLLTKSYGTLFQKYVQIDDDEYIVGFMY